MVNLLFIVSGLCFLSGILGFAGAKPQYQQQCIVALIVGAVFLSAGLLIDKANKKKLDTDKQSSQTHTGIIDENQAPPKKKIRLRCVPGIS